MNISVVLLQATLSEFTRRAVNSIWNSTLVPDEVILVDNGSGEDDKSWARDTDIRLIELERNYGYHFGMNIGWKAALGDYILLCNNDIALSSQCIYRLVNAMERNPDYGWMAASYINGHFDFNRTPAPADVLKEVTDSEGSETGKLDAWAYGLGDEPNILIPPFIDDTVVMVRKSVSDKIGYFWEDIKYGGHTHDYGMRLALAGYKQGVVKNAVFWHRLHHQTIAKFKLFLNDDEMLRTNALLHGRWGDGWTRLEPKPGVRWEDMR